MKLRKHWWIWILVGIYIWLIFRNSLMVASVSDALSSRVTHELMNILQHFGLYADFSTFHHYVRKLAHFTEFAGLGFLVVLAMHICPLFHHRSLNFLLFLFSVPFADEMIQLHVAGRSSQFTDMLIDCSGCLFGGFLCYVLFLILKDLFHHQKHQS